MGRYFALTLGIPAQTQTKAKPKRKVEYNTQGLGFWIAALIVIFGGVYLVQVNDTSTKGYEIKTLERRLAEVRDANKRLELETGSLQSIQRIEGTVKTLNLVPSGKVFYVGENGYAYQNR